MNRYLLFDSGCFSCTSLAQQIESISKGWLTVRSLRDPDMQSLLDRTRPGWKWEPMLLESDENRTTISSGTALRLKILLGLGPERTWQVAQLVARTTAVSTNRRNFLAKGTAIVSGIALGLGWGQFAGSKPAYASTKATSSLPQIKHLTINDPEITPLKQSYAVKTASKHFGNINWSQVHKVQLQSSSQPGYIVLLEPQHTNGSSIITFIAISNILSQGNTPNVVGRITYPEQGKRVIDWFSINNHHLGSTVATAQGTQAYAAIPNPDLNIGCFGSCFAKCVGETVNEVCRDDYCVDCAISIAQGSPFPDCVPCAICAGSSAINCATSCYAKCP